MAFCRLCGDDSMVILVFNGPVPPNMEETLSRLLQTVPTGVLDEGFGDDVMQALAAQVCESLGGRRIVPDVDFDLDTMILRELRARDMREPLGFTPPVPDAPAASPMGDPDIDGIGLDVLAELA